MVENCLVHRQRKHWPLLTIDHSTLKNPKGIKESVDSEKKTDLNTFDEEMRERYRV